MNTSIKTLTATALIAIVGAAGFVIAAPEQAAVQEIVQLERVVITGTRAEPEMQMAQHIEQLPRVVIHGRSAQPDTQVASAKTCAAQAIC